MMESDEASPGGEGSERKSPRPQALSEEGARVLHGRLSRAVAAVCPAWLAEQAEGLVRPIRQVKINAAVAGKLVDIAVTEGAVVQAGQTLGQIDDRVQAAAVAAAKVQAESTAEVDHAALQLAEAKVSLEEMTSAYEKKAANEWEVRRATLQVKLGEAAEKVAREKLDYARAQLAMEQADQAIL